MATNGSLPNTIYPPPLYYHRLQRDEEARGYSTPEERLDFCYKNQRPTAVYDAKATAVHWEAIVGGPSQPTDEKPDHDQKLKDGAIAIRDGHKPPPLLMALAKEILSLEAEDSSHFEGGEEVEATPTKSKKATSRSKHVKKPTHSKASAKEFVRECCVAGDTKTISARVPATFIHTPGGKMANLRSVGRAHNTSRVPHFQSPRSSCRGRTATSKIHNSRTDYYHTPTSGDGQGRRLVVHMPNIPPRQGGRNIGNITRGTTGHRNAGLTYGVSEDASVKQPSPVKTLMDELDTDITQAGSVTNETSLELPAETANVNVFPSRLQNIHMLAPEENPTSEGHVDTSTRPLATQDVTMLQLDKESLWADNFVHRSEASSIPVSRVEFKGSLLGNAGASSNAGYKAETRNTVIEREANIHKANERIEMSSGTVCREPGYEASANVDTFREAGASVASNATSDDGGNSVPGDTSEMESVQTDWDDYSDDFTSESP